MSQLKLNKTTKRYLRAMSCNATPTRKQEKALRELVESLGVAGVLNSLAAELQRQTERVDGRMTDDAYEFVSGETQSVADEVQRASEVVGEEAAALADEVLAATGYDVDTDSQRWAPLPTTK